MIIFGLLIFIPDPDGPVIVNGVLVFSKHNVVLLARTETPCDMRFAAAFAKAVAAEQSPALAAQYSQQPSTSRSRRTLANAFLEER